MLNLRPNAHPRPRPSLGFWAVSAAALAICASTALAQAPATPAAPAAPAAPAVTPAAPTPAEIAARARAAALAAKANIDIAEAWTRATPANATTAAVFLHLVSAKDADKLIDVEAANAGHVELRDDTPPNAAAKGVAAPALDIAAGGTVNFAPGGRALTLVGLKSPLKEGESFLLTFRFEKAGTQNTVVKVLGATANGPPPANTARKGDTTAGVSPR